MKETTKLLAFMGSPRKGGNTDTFLDAVIEAAKGHGADIQKVNLYKINFEPCIECGACDKDGKCPLKDDLSPLYSSIAIADCIIAASPIFFYNITAKTQALVERMQAFWVKKYVLKQAEVNKKKKDGIFIGIGATRGKSLFDGPILTMKYFFDAISCENKRAFLYRGIEKRAEVKGHKDIMEEAETIGKRLALNLSLNDIGISI